MEQDKKEEDNPTTANKSASPQAAAVLAWSQALPQAMPIKGRGPTYLDQPFAQSVARYPRYHTVRQWAEPLRPVAVTISCLEGSPGEVAAQLGGSAALPSIPMRKAFIGSFMSTNLAVYTATPRFTTIKSVISQPVGDFQASRFFNFPGSVNTQAVAQIVAAVGSSLGSMPDEAPFVRAALISELCISPANIQRATQLPARCSVTFAARTVDRAVSGFGDMAPDGKLLAVDLSLFAQLLSGAFHFQGDLRACFSPETWESETAIVPIRGNLSGHSCAPAYALSFVDSAYYNLRVWWKTNFLEEIWFGFISRNVFRE